MIKFLFSVYTDFFLIVRLSAFVVVSFMRLIDHHLFQGGRSSSRIQCIEGFVEGNMLGFFYSTNRVLFQSI